MMKTAAIGLVQAVSPKAKDTARPILSRDRTRIFDLVRAKGGEAAVEALRAKVDRRDAPHEIRQEEKRTDVGDRPSEDRFLGLPPT